MQLVFLGAIVYAHFGTPCNTFSAARKEDGGPPPLRDVHHPDGLPSLTGDLWFTTFLGNLFRDRTCEACFVLVLLGESNLGNSFDEFSFVQSQSIRVRL